MKWIFYSPEEGTVKSICYYAFWLVASIALAVFLYIDEQSYFNGSLSAVPVMIYLILLADDVFTYVKNGRNSKCP